METKPGVNFYNFQKLHNDKLKKDILADLTEIIEHSSFVEGKFNDEFEKEFAKFLGSKYCLLVANGTDALQLSLQALDIAPGDYVGVPGITFHATASATYQMGAKPVYIDVDPHTGLICVESLKRIHKEYKLKAIMPVHIYGQPAPMNDLEKFCQNENILIVEDAAQAHGALYDNGNKVGNGNNLTTFSFYPTKNLGAFGDAGAITFNDEKYFQKLISLRNHGRTPDGIKLIGHNSRCDHMQAAVLCQKLKYLEQWNNSRKEIAKTYMQELEGLPLKTLPPKFLTSSSWHLFPILLENAGDTAKLREHLSKEKIGTALFYEKSVPELEAFAHFPGERELAKDFAAKSLCLPIHPFVDSEQVSMISSSVRQFFKK